MTADVDRGCSGDVLQCIHAQRSGHAVRVDCQASGHLVPVLRGIQDRRELNRVANVVEC